MAVRPGSTYIASTVIVSLHSLLDVLLVVNMLVAVILDIQTSIVDENIDASLSLLFLYLGSKSFDRSWVFGFILGSSFFVSSASLACMLSCSFVTCYRYPE